MYRDNIARTMEQRTMRQWKRDNKTKESNLKGTMEGL